MNAIIILNYNDFETTVNMIERIKGFRGIDKIIIVDNHSTDGSFEILKQYLSDRIDVICTPSNKGYASGNNYGIKYAIEKYRVRNMIISNPDIIISDESILKLFEILETIPNVGMITGVIHDPLGRIVNNYAWKLPKYKDLLINSSIVLTKIAKLFNLGQLYRKSLISKSKMLRVDVIPGCFFAISSKVINEVDYFDERTFLFHEENILAHKLKCAKYDNYIITTEKIIHLESISIKKTFNSLIKRRQINFESSLVYMKEYLGCSDYLIGLYSFVNKLFDFENLVIYKLKSAKDIYFK